MIRILLRRLGLLLAGLLPLMLIGCQVGGSQAFIQGDTPAENNVTYTGAPVTGDWVVVNLLDEPENLNPFVSTSASATIINSYIYESFLTTERRPPWDDTPLLASELPEVSPDHLRYKWKLRPEARWHDGKPITMTDVVFSLKALMNPYVDDLPTKPYYAELDSLRMPDDYTLEMFCSKPYFLHQDFLGSFTVLPKHIFDTEGLMDDLTYFQVARGSYYGKFADALASDPKLSRDQLPSAVLLAGLEKSVGNITGNRVKWSDLVKSVPGWKEMAPSARISSVIESLGGSPDSAEVQRWISETGRTIAQALGATPFTGDISRSVAPGSFPHREEFAAWCRDAHTRIEKFGNQFNEHPQNRAPTVGSGPYIFDHWVTGQELVLRRNENYWRGPGCAWLDKIVWRVLTDQTASLVALKNGEIDFMENLQTIQYLTMTNRKKFLNQFVKSTFTVPSYGYLGWRQGCPLFRDKRVRTAMTHMVRRKDMAAKILFGFAEIVTGPFYRYGPDYDSTIVPLEYDPEKAMELLREAGWADTDNDGILEKDTLEFRFELLIPSGSPFADQLASILREDLYMIGVEMNIRRLEWSVFINNYIRNHTFDACYLGWVFGMKGDPKQVWHSESASGRGSNHVEFRNAECDSLIDAARLEFDQSKRVTMYHRFQRILHEEQPYTFLFSSMQKPSYSKRFKGVKWYPFRPGFQLDEWFVPQAEQRFK